MMELISLIEMRNYSEDKFVKQILMKKGGHVAFVLNFLPGQSLPAHTHSQSVLFLTVVEGGGTVSINGMEKMVTKDDFLVIEGDEPFGFVNTISEPTQLYVVLCKCFP